MKLLHFADLHIGVETHGRPDPTTGWSTRLHDFLGAFDDLVDTAIAEGVDAVLFAGDAYKSRNPDQTHQREFAKRIVRLARADIPVYLLVGNHDVPTMVTRASALEIFSTLDVQKVHIGGRAGLTRIETRAGPLQIVGQPWPSVSQLLRRDEHKNLTLDEVDRLVERAVAEGIAYWAEQLDPALPSVLVAHIAMSDSIVKTASEKMMTVGRFPQLNRSDLCPHAFDYIALGHHHCFQVLHEHPPMVYAGSMQRVDFGEETDPKGFVLVDLDPARPRGERVTAADVRFHELQARRFLTFAVSPREEDPTEETLAQIMRADTADAIVRVLLTLSPAQNKLLDERRLREALARAHVVASISRTITHGARSRLGSETLPETLTPLDAMSLWLNATNEPQDRREERCVTHAR
ncbi:MAG: exonuclease SbcCD subunit D [Dehalococcoidia bacterium]